MSLSYRSRSDHRAYLATGEEPAVEIECKLFAEALHASHSLIDKIYSFDVDISEILGMRNLSAFIGELYVSSFSKVSGGVFLKNPHQDGYPDLLLMDTRGKREFEVIRERNGLREKAPFSPFSRGGVEVKATCGSVPTPAQCAKLGLEKPGIGDQRIDLLKGYDWKAHHRETNNLVGLLWDFIEGRPRIVA